MPFPSTRSAGERDIGSNLRKNQFHELGEVIADATRGRAAESQVTVCDLTGVAIQDIQIADVVYTRLREAAKSTS